jgi:hypothetical protein
MRITFVTMLLMLHPRFDLVKLNAPAIPLCWAAGQSKRPLLPVASWVVLLSRLATLCLHLMCRSATSVPPPDALSSPNKHGGQWGSLNSPQ